MEKYTFTQKRNESNLDWEIEGKRTSYPDCVMVEKTAICKFATISLRYVGNPRNSDKTDIRRCSGCRIRLFAPLALHGTYSFDKKSGIYDFPSVESGEFEKYSRDLLEVNEIIKECEKMAEVMISDISVVLAQ